MEEINLREFFFKIRKSIWIVILITVIFVAISGGVSFFVLEPEYETFTTLILSKPNTSMDSNDMIQYNDVLLNQKLVATYGELAKSRVVSNEVIKNMELDLTPGELSKKINISLVKDTEIIKITTTDRDPKIAADIANETAQVFMKYVKDIMRIENVQIIDKAQEPLNSIKPRPMLYMALAGVLGIMISVFLIFLLDYLDNTIKTSADVERYLDLPILGTIPKSSKELIIQHNPKSLIAEAFRTLRTSIQFSNIDKDVKTIVITSSGPTEGKSTIIANLAVIMAQVDKQILLIDNDLRKPRIHTIFGLSNINGFTTVLAEGLSYNDVVIHTGIGKLDVLTSGPVPPNPAELLGSKKMKAFLEKVREEYDIILLDAPPVGVVTDAAVLSTIVDSTILVCSVGETVIDVAKNAKAFLKRVNANILGVVINKAPVDENGYYKYYVI